MPGVAWYEEEVQRRQSVDKNFSPISVMIPDHQLHESLIDLFHV
jgi:hypothetical protein